MKATKTEAEEARVLYTLQTHFDMVGGWITAVRLFPGSSKSAIRGRLWLRRLAAEERVKHRWREGAQYFAPIISDVDERTCRVCACTHDRACHDDAAGPCSWVEDDLCSHCAPGGSAA